MRNAYRAAAAHEDSQPEPAEPEPVVEGYTHPRRALELNLPPQGEARRFILTCAQNNTYLHPVFDALLTAAKYLDAELIVTRFTYNVTAYGRGSVKPGREIKTEGIWYDPRVEPYVVDSRVQLAPGLVWCGELNILPTAQRPLSGLETYTARDSAIVPHPKLEMVSVPSGKFEATKFLYTTGACTLRNYIQKKAGQKAEFWHTYGALLVEVDAEGNWYVRQLEADPETGNVRDLRREFQATGHVQRIRPEAIVWGDVHEARLDTDIARLCWGERGEGILDELRPRFQFFHDLLDFRARNHHEVDDPHIQFQRYVEGEHDVAEELASANGFLARRAQRDWCLSVVVESNHDKALARWLREADYRRDPANALTFLRLQLRYYLAIANQEQDFHLLAHALQRYGSRLGLTKFLFEDESFVLCRGRDDSGIECGMHGHLGPNGRPGSPRAFSRMGRRVVHGHTHSAGILDDVWTAGLMANPDLGYNRGPSSWSQSFVLVHSNGACQIVTLWNGKWRA